MENLKENELPKEIMDFISGGTQAQIDELYNFYKSQGVKMGKDKVLAVADCLNKDLDLFGDHGGFTLDSKKQNMYMLGHENADGKSVSFLPQNHTDFMKYLIGCYAAGKGHCGK